MAHRHLHGKVNTGQDQLLEYWILNDIKSGAAVCVIDQTGTLTTKLIPKIPRRHCARVVDFNPAQYSIPFNPFLTETVPFSTDTMATAIKYGFGFSDTQTARMTGLLSNLVYALIEARQGLFGMYLMLDSPKYRKHVLEAVSSAMVRRFWARFDRHNEKWRDEQIDSTFNKVQVLMLDPRIQAISGTASSLDLSDMVKDKVLFVRLPQGEFGVEKTTLLSNIMLTLVYQACLSRDTTLPFNLYIKDISRIDATIIKDILAFGADYEVHLTVSTNYFSQVESTLMDALAANTDQYIFRVSKSDADQLQQTKAQDFPLYETLPFQYVRFYDGSYTRHDVPELTHPTYAKSAQTIHNRMAKRLHSPATQEIDALMRKFS